MSKFGSKRVEIGGITFDSIMEADYYLYLKKLEEQGIVTDIRLQPRFTLLEQFTKRGIKFRKIEYVADFEVTYPNGQVEIIDVKGVETDVFKIKRKLFEYLYPHELKLVTFVKKYGGWITLDELKKLRKMNKKSKK